MLKNVSQLTWSTARSSVVHVALNRILSRNIAAAFLFCAAVLSALGQTAVLTGHNDNSRTGQNTTETILNTSNVNKNQFGKLFALPTVGQIYAQPLYVPGITVNGATHNVLIVATEADIVYAFDADSNGAPLWKTSLLGAGETALNSATTINCSDMQPTIGITSTPVIDRTSNTIYVEAKSTNGSSYFHRLHALNLLTGGEKSPGPTLITATVTGTGDGSTGGHLTFDPLHQLARPGLLLVNGTVYIAYASHCDFSPYHGWLFAYDEATLAQRSVYVTTPNGGLGGFWMSGAGIAADASGTIFIPSGNGDFDTTHVPATETGDSVLKLGTTNQTLTLLDYFTPQDQSSLNSGDLDLGSGGAMLLPDQPGTYPHILVQSGKEGWIYVVNRDQLTKSNSHYCSGCSTNPEIVEESSNGAIGGVFGAPAYWNNHIYYWAMGDVLNSIPITNGLPDFASTTKGSTFLDFPGATPSISSNGTQAGTGIVWAINSSQYGSPGPGPGPAVLYAFDATNVSTQLWNSTQAANSRDKAGNAVKFSTPTIANGKVYVGTSGEVDVYGLLISGSTVVQISPTMVNLSASQTQQFTATVTGTTNTSVTWSLSPAVGTLSSTGLYTAPSSITTAQTVNITATSVADKTQSATAQVNLQPPTSTGTFSTIRVHAGGAAYSDTLGQQWSADTGFSGGQTASVTHSINGTPDPALYQTERFGVFTYTFTVPNGSYNVLLKFAEDYWSDPGQRVFNVAINGGTVLTNFDIVAQAGAPFTAIDKTFPVTVTNGAVTIQFIQGSADLPKIDAIQIGSPAVGVQVSPTAVSLSASQTQQFTATVTGASNTSVTWSLSPAAGTVSSTGLYTAPSSITAAQTVNVTATSVADKTRSATGKVNLQPPTGSGTFTPIRIRGGAAAAYTDKLGQQWSADAGFSGGNAASFSNSISGTNDPALYQTERFGVFTYTFTVPNGSYNVLLKFAEDYWSDPGQRVFSVAINGTQVLTDFDIVAQAGAPNTALDKTFPVTVANGTVTIQFIQGAADVPKIDAIQITAKVGVQVSPTAANLSASKTQQFTSTVTGTSNTGVTWSLSPAVGSLSSTGLYTAPSSISTAQTVNVTVTSVADKTQSATAKVNLQSTSGTFTPIRIRAGGAAAYTDKLGQQWSADAGFSGGNTATFTNSISGTSDPALYQTERYGVFTYTFTVPNASYNVLLKFAEDYYGWTGQRVFNVAINGTQVLTNFDIVAAAGGPNKALDKTFPVTVTNGTITIQFIQGSEDLPKVDAIQIAH